MIYMWALPIAFPQRYKNVKLQGRVQYGDHAIDISPTDVDADFLDALKALMKRMASDGPLVRAPSPSECRFCPITSDDCSERVEWGTGEGHVVVAEL
jgi:hypothetical protein